LASFGVLPYPALANSASLFLSPGNGSVVTGSTFNTSILVDTGGQAINAVSIDITFPPQLLQVVGPDPGSSFIAIWTKPPTFSNSEGKIHLEGGVPNPGLTSSSATVLTLTFRAKAPGQAKIKIEYGTKLLANDGAGTNIFITKSDAVVSITAKPPGGPTISSPTHPDQSAWYNNANPQFTWDSPQASTAISWSYDQNPTTTPDTTPEPMSQLITTKAEKDGAWYIHLRTQADGAWGGASHFTTQIDTTAPAKFTPTVEPQKITVHQRAMVSFATTDAASGISHYEIKVESAGANTASSFFIEQPSPYMLPELEAGKQVVTVRAYDKAGNLTESHLDITVTSLVAGGLSIGTDKSSSSLWLIIGLSGFSILLFFLILFLLWRQRHMYRTQQIVIPQGLTTPASVHYALPPPHDQLPSNPPNNYPPTNQI
jgi:hypothetical protein